MTATTRAHDEPAPGARLYGMYVVSLVVCLLGNLLIRLGAEAGWLGHGGQVALAVLAAAPLFVAVTLFWRMLRGELDELMQRVVCEGMAFALVVYVPLAALYVNLRAAGVAVPRLDPPELVLGPALLAAVGIALAWRRYQ
jgi:hypothetical protein